MAVSADASWGADAAWGPMGEGGLSVTDSGKSSIVVGGGPGIMVTVMAEPTADLIFAGRASSMELSESTLEDPTSTDVDSEEDEMPVVEPESTE